MTNRAGNVVGEEAVLYCYEPESNTDKEYRASVVWDGVTYYAVFKWGRRGIANLQEKPVAFRSERLARRKVDETILSKKAKGYRSFEWYRENFKSHPVLGSGSAVKRREEANKAERQPANPGEDPLGSGMWCVLDFRGEPYVEEGMEEPRYFQNRADAAQYHRLLVDQPSARERQRQEKRLQELSAEAGEERKRSETARKAWRTRKENQKEKKTSDVARLVGEVAAKAIDEMDDAVDAAFLGGANTLVEEARKRRPVDAGTLRRSSTRLGDLPGAPKARRANPPAPPKADESLGFGAVRKIRLKD